MMVLPVQPPNIEDIIKTFPKVKESKGIVYTHGQVIFNPDNQPLTEELMHHEATHSLQQDELGYEKWWKKYLEDKDFRLSQELQAYHQQYKKYCKNVKDRNKQAQYLNRLALDCSSEIYGNMTSYREAIQGIKHYESK